jgi:hypothetical protein
MDMQVLLTLLALPLVAAGLIVAVSVVRRRRPPAGAASREPVHRLQADSATVQDSAEPAPVAPPAKPSGRARRATSAGTREDA